MAAKKFKTRVVGDGPGAAWCRIQLPFDVEKTWGAKGRLSVQGSANGFSFRSSIFPNGDGTHHMMFNKAMQEGSGAGPGDAVALEMEPDTTKRSVDLPDDLAAAMTKRRKAKEGFASLSPSNQKGYVDWITGAKKAETRAVRVVKAIERLEKGEKFW